MGEKHATRSGQEANFMFDLNMQGSLEALFDLLTQEALDPTFEKYGNFIEQPRMSVLTGYDSGTAIWEDRGPTYPDRPNALQFFGNFLNYSFVFDITTDDPEMIVRLTTAIRANQQLDAYRAARTKPGCSTKQICVGTTGASHWPFVSAA